MEIKAESVESQQRNLKSEKTDDQGCGTVCRQCKKGQVEGHQLAKAMQGLQRAWRFKDQT